MGYFCQEWLTESNYEETIKQTQIETYSAKQLSWNLQKYQCHKRRKVGGTVFD